MSKDMTRKEHFEKELITLNNLQSFVVVELMYYQELVIENEKDDIAKGELKAFRQVKMVLDGEIKRIKNYIECEG